MSLFSAFCVVTYVIRDWLLEFPHKVDKGANSGLNVELEIVLRLGLESEFAVCGNHNQATLVVVSVSGDNWLEVGKEVVLVYAEDRVNHKERSVIENDNTLIFIDSNEDVGLKEGFQVVSAEKVT